MLILEARWQLIEKWVRQLQSSYYLGVNSQKSIFRWNNEYWIRLNYKIFNNFKLIAEKQ